MQAAAQALGRRRPADALRALAEAQALRPGDPEVFMQQALALRLQGDLPAAVAALDEALALDAYNVLALLSKGALLERTQGRRAAAVVYRDVLKIAPRADATLAALAAPLARAREVVDGVGRELEAHLRVATRDGRGELSREQADRFDEALGVFAGVRRVFVQEPLLLHYPRLPAIPFHPRASFPWLEALEAATDTIRGELEALLATARDSFAPYIAYPKWAPVNQWAELNHSPRWSSVWLWNNGVRVEEACARCPGTVAAMERLPMMDLEGFAPTVVFSALDPHTHIPPHTGSTNVRLLCHLPLILPGPARFRVGGDERSWRMGEAWVFDDTIEHEAWNDADALRAILIIDVWNPLLSEAERTLVGAMLRARGSFAAG